MKIIGFFLLLLVATSSAWPFSFWGATEKKQEGEQSDVILNYDAGDHKHIQTGRAGEEVHGVFSIKEADGKVRTTNYKADKEGFKADITVENVSKQSEEVVDERKPPVDKVIKDELNEPLKKEEVKNDSPKKDEQDFKKKNEGKVNFGHGKLVHGNIASLSNKDEKIQNDEADNAAVVVQNSDLNSNQQLYSDFVQSLSNKHPYKPLISYGSFFDPQSYYKPKPNPLNRHPIRAGYPNNFFNKPFPQIGILSFYRKQKPYQGFMMNYPNRNQQSLTHYRKKPMGYPFYQKSQPLYPFINYREQKPFYLQQNKEKIQQHSYFRPNFRLENPYVDDSQAFDDEFYFPERGENYQDSFETEDPVNIANKADNDHVYQMTEKEEDAFMERLTPKQVEGLYNTFIN